MLIMKDGTSIDCSQSGNQGILIPHMEDVESVVTTASHVLIVEKESSFSELLSNDIIDASQEDLILVTGKGYPDISSRLLVKLLSQIVRAKEVRNAMGEMELQMVPPPRISCLTDGMVNVR